MTDNMTTDKPMSNEEIIEVLKGIVFNGFDRTTRKERQALDLAIKALKDVDMLEDENHKNFVNSQHIISSLIEEIKKLKKEIKKLKKGVKKNEKTI